MLARGRLAAVLPAVAVLAGCGGATPAAHHALAVAHPSRDRWGTVWLCRPGLARDPCTTSRATTVFGRDGTSHVVAAAPAKNPPVDCFYVYPTVSLQATANANLHVDPTERAVAVAQASRFSQVCRVYAPMYRQITLGSILRPGGINAVTGSWPTERTRRFRDYLAHYNDGRGIVFIGHSQGATILIRLLQQEVDAARACGAGSSRRCFSAATSPSRRAGPSAATSTHPGLHVAPKPAASSPTRATRRSRRRTAVRAHRSDGARLLAPRHRRERAPDPVRQPGRAGRRHGGPRPVLPVAGADLRARRAKLSVTTPWVAFPGEFTAAVIHRRRDVAAARVRPAPDRARAGQPPDAADRGAARVDVNIALGDLVALVRDESTAYRG